MVFNTIELSSALATGIRCSSLSAPGWYSVVFSGGVTVIVSRSRFMFIIFGGGGGGGGCDVAVNGTSFRSANTQRNGSAKLWLKQINRRTNESHEPQYECTTHRERENQERDAQMSKLRWIGFVIKLNEFFALFSFTANMLLHTSYKMS